MHWGIPHSLTHSHARAAIVQLFALPHRNDEKEGGELDASEDKEAKGPPVRRITDFFGAK